MGQVVGLPSNSYKPFTNTAWVRARFCNLQKGCTRLATASDKVYQLLAHGRWFSPSTPASSTTKTGRHDIAESGVKHQKINQSLLVNWPKLLLPICILLMYGKKTYLNNEKYQTVFLPLISISKISGSQHFQNSQDCM